MVLKIDILVFDDHACEFNLVKQIKLRKLQDIKDYLNIEDSLRIKVHEDYDIFCEKFINSEKRKKDFVAGGMIFNVQLFNEKLTGPFAIIKSDKSNMTDEDMEFIKSKSTIQKPEDALKIAEALLMGMKIKEAGKQKT